MTQPDQASASAAISSLQVIVLFVPDPAKSSVFRARVALVALGLSAYWPQFEGLEPRLRGYESQVRQRIGELDIDTVPLTGADGQDLNMIDTPEKAVEAGHALRRADVDLVLIYVATYALSSTVLPMV